MRRARSLEPNPAGHRVLTPGFFNDLAAWVEEITSHNRAPGLLPSHGGGLPRYLGNDVLVLDSIAAFGANGCLINSYEDGGRSSIEPLDVSDKPAGKEEYRVYACLAVEKPPAGKMVELPPSTARPYAVRFQQYRRPRILLEVGPEHTRHIDWLQIGAFQREKLGGGHTRTIWNEAFHPAVTSMQAYRRANPLLRVAELLLEEINLEDPTNQALACELRVLRNIAETASPEAAFCQAQRCLGMLTGTSGLARRLRGRFLNHRFRNDTFCRFLADLDHAIAVDRKELYPTTLRLGDTTFQLTDGLFEARDQYWVWRAPGQGFNINGLAVLFPGATEGELTNFKFSPTIDELNAGSFGVASPARDVDFPGVAMVLGHKGEIAEMVIAEIAAGSRHVLSTWMEEGHRVYYR